MSRWGAEVYGDPCACGFRWSLGLPGAVAVVARLPAAYRQRLSGAVGTERRPDLAWSVAEYVCHVGDNLRIWAERLAGAEGPARAVVGVYDENELRRVRDYPSIGLPAALWSLERAVGDWLAAVGRTDPAVLLVHPERGVETLTDVAVSNAHDGEHHLWDVERSLTG